MRIKEGEELKAAFSTSEDAFELTVIFFGLINSLVTFQAMMNDLFRDMIEIEDMAAFIDDVMVGKETEEEYDDILEEVLRRIAENDLLVKPEKCMWKIREIGFLEGVIAPDGMKIEKEKVQRVVDWPVPKGIKNVQKFLELANHYR